jgi:hypothetical protein
MQAAVRRTEPRQDGKNRIFNLMNASNIFIPSRGRAGISALLSHLKSSQVLVNLVVEPQELSLYQDEYADCFNYLTLPKGGQGITYVRNYIKELSERLGMCYYWQLDDDISALYQRTGQKLQRVGHEALACAAEVFKKEGIALGALEYRQYAWSANKSLILNSFCDVCVYVDNGLTNGMRYDPRVEGKEDRDFAMQVIQRGLKTARLTDYAFSAPPNGSNAGGLKDIFYDAGREQQCAEAMVKKWGANICNLHTKLNGRVDVKINWANISSKQIFLF